MTKEHAAMKPTTGILICNLGTPQSPTTKGVRQYLAEFLNDPRVVNLPWLIRFILLHGLILRVRPRQSAKLYQKIWTDKGSPLLVHSQAITEKLQTILADDDIQVLLAMRYGQPSIVDAMETFRQQNIRRLIVLPLYPQYSTTTTASVFDAVNNALRKWAFLPEVQFINGYADNEAYISGLTTHIENYLQEHGMPTHFLFSFHGIPKRLFEKGDPYYCFCHKTARLVSEKLGLSEDKWTLCFQSQFGKAKWLEPSISQALRNLAKAGVKNVAVVCPGFACDCLETLEEINIREREQFIAAGGESFHYIPALNASHEHVATLKSVLRINNK